MARVAIQESLMKIGAYWFPMIAISVSKLARPVFRFQKLFRALSRFAPDFARVHSDCDAFRLQKTESGERFIRETDVIGVCTFGARVVLVTTFDGSNPIWACSKIGLGGRWRLRILRNLGRCSRIATVISQSSRPRPSETFASMR